MTRRTVMECIHMRMELCIKANGRMICRMGKESRAGVTIRSIKVATKKEKNMERVNFLLKNRDFFI